MSRVIRRLLTLAGRHGGRLSVIDYGEGLAIAAAAHPIELVVNLDGDQVEELANILANWRGRQLLTEFSEATVQP